MSKLFDKAIIFNMASLYNTDRKTVATALAEENNPSDVKRFATENIAIAMGALAEPIPSYDTALSVCRILNPALATAQAEDPAESQWRRLGLVVPVPVCGEAYGDETPMAVAVAGTSAILMMAELRERKLPSASINDKLVERVAEFERKEGRAAHKKDIAMLKDEITAKMLKHAPITRKRVPILLQDGLCIMFTSSAKLTDDVSGMLRQLLGTWPAVPVLVEGVSAWMKDIAIRGIDEDVDEDIFVAADSAKLVDTSGDKAVITIKDEQISCTGGTLDTLLDAGRTFDVDEMAITFYPDGHDPDKMIVDMKVHKNGIIKKLAIRDLTDADLDRIIERFDGNTLEEEYDRALRPMAGLYILGHVIHQLVRRLADGGPVYPVPQNLLGFMRLDDLIEAKRGLEAKTSADDDIDRELDDDDEEWESIEDMVNRQKGVGRHFEPVDAEDDDEL